MTQRSARTTDPLALVAAASGMSVIPTATPLTRLHYYDGKFLRADDLNLEQRGMRQLVQLSNQASGGPGIVHGFRARFNGGDGLDIGPGLAIDAAGRVIHLPQPVSASITEIFDSSRAAPAAAAPRTGPRTAPRTGPARAATRDAAGDMQPCEVAPAEPPGDPLEDGDLHLITIGHIEAYCGQEDVYGDLCGASCVKSTERPYIIEGVVIRAVPLRLDTVLATSQEIALQPIHLRSLIASAYFADEQRTIPALLSAEALMGETWGAGATAASGDVALGVLYRQGTTNRFFDAWMARRERMGAPPQRYWEQRVAMRPWSVFLAQMLQFQTQLGHTLASMADATPARRVLIHGGIIELPSAGYLPVSPASIDTVNRQVRRLLGEGVDLRFCVVRPDVIAHAIEEARHLDRISLLQGIDDPDRKPAVDILVPDGEIITHPPRWLGVPVSGSLTRALIGAGDTSDGSPQVFASRVAQGAGRAERLPGDGGAFSYAGAAAMSRLDSEEARSSAVLTTRARASAHAVWLTMRCERDLFAMSRLQTTPASLRMWYAGPAQDDGIQDAGGIDLHGTIEIKRITGTERSRHIEARWSGVETSHTFDERPQSHSVAVTGALAVTRAIEADGTIHIEATLSAGLFGEHSFLFRYPDDAGAITASWIQHGEMPTRVAVELQRDLSVLRPDNPTRLAALWGLTLIEQATAQQSLADTAAHQLFPPAPPTAEPLQIRAVNDWVLFHRRRTRICESPDEIILPAPARRYQLYHIAAGSSEEAAGYLANLANLASLPRDLLVPVTIVEFAGGVPAVATDPQALITAWQQHAEGRALFHGALASRPAAAADGDVLALGRLDRLAQMLEGVTPVPAEASWTLLPALPPMLTVAGTDGSILLITLPAPALGPTDREGPVVPRAAAPAAETTTAPATPRTATRRTRATSAAPTRARRTSTRNNND